MPQPDPGSRNPRIEASGSSGVRRFSRRLSTGTTLGLVALIVFQASPASGYEESDTVGGGRSTHQTLMDRILNVLEADGHTDLARYLRENLATLKTGTVRADWTLIDSGNHYMDPFTGEGLPGFRSAGELARIHVREAETFWRGGDHWSAIEALGRILHLIQDLTVPHHARLTPRDFHAEYERWVTDHIKRLPLPEEGIYELNGSEDYPRDPYPWLVAAGLASYPLFALVDGADKSDGDDYEAAARELVPLAVALSAGFTNTFFESLDSASPVVDWTLPEEGRVGIPVEMDCLGCVDDGVIVQYIWTADGQLLTGAVVRPVFSRAGLFNVSLTVVDHLGKEASVSGQIWVRDSPFQGVPIQAATVELFVAGVGIVAGVAVAAVVATTRRSGARHRSKEAQRPPP